MTEQFIPEGSVWLRGGSTYHTGRVEIFHDGTWGTICDDNWDISDAKVVCRQLGFPGAIRAYSSAYFGQGEGQIWLNELKCAGSESRLSSCGRSSWGVHNCGHSEDAGVKCGKYDPVLYADEDERATE